MFRNTVLVGRKYPRCQRLSLRRAFGICEIRDTKLSSLQSGTALRAALQFHIFFFDGEPGCSIGNIFTRELNGSVSGNGYFMYCWINHMAKRRVYFFDVVCPFRKLGAISLADIVGDDFADLG